MTASTRSAPSDKALLRDVSSSVALIGAGKMGGAMLEGWLGLGLDPTRIVVVEPKPSPEIAALVARGVVLNPSARAIRPAAIIVAAVKPQVAAQALPAAAPLVGPSSLVLSIMAGKTLGFLERNLPAGTAIVRSMPNLPASIGRGITVAVANARVTGPQRALVDRLLAATGAVEWIQDESLLDAVTAVSGSGPAYVFLLAETLARAGAAAGLPPDLAARLARATVAGSGALIEGSPLDPAKLRENVTSPGGTTAAALDVLMGGGGLPALVQQAVEAATRRSRELAE